MHTNIVDPTENNPLLREAQNFWKYLDNLAESDPEQYQSFVKEQQAHAREEAKAKMEEHFFKPLPVFCLKTSIAEREFVISEVSSGMEVNHKIFVNMLQSPYCHKLRSKTGDEVTPQTPLAHLLIPFSVGKKFAEKDKGGRKCWRFDVVSHTSVYEFGENNATFAKWHIETVLRQIESVHRFKLSRDYRRMKNMTFFGKAPIVQQRREQPTLPSATPRTTTVESPQSLIEELNSLRVSESKPPASKSKSKLSQSLEQREKQPADQNTDSPIVLREALPSLFNIRESKSPMKEQEEKARNESPLIQEISRKPLIEEIVEGDSKERPEVEIVKNVVKSRFEMSIRLPKEESAERFELDISNKFISLESEFYSLEFNVPTMGDGKKAVARFNASKRCLNVRIPFKAR